jgi:hypothetical protein
VFESTISSSTLPASCTRESWKTDGSCKMQLELLGGEMLSLTFAVSKCSGTWMPDLEIGCKGKLCSKLLMPCNPNSATDECGLDGEDAAKPYASCKPLFDVSEEDAAEALDEIAGASFIGDGQTCGTKVPSAVVTSMAASNESVSGKYFLSRLMGVWNYLAFGKEDMGVVAGTHVCGIDKLGDISSLDLMAIKAWDGEGPPKGPKFNLRIPAKLSLPSDNTLTALPLMRAACDSTISLTPASPLSLRARAGSLHLFLDRATKVLKDIVKCRFAAKDPPAAVSDDAFRMRWQITDLGFLLNYMTTSLTTGFAPIDTPPGLDLLTELFGEDGTLSASDIMLALPDTCSYNSWITR